MAHTFSSTFAISLQFFFFSPKRKIVRSLMKMLLSNEYIFYFCKIHCTFLMLFYWLNGMMETVFRKPSLSFFFLSFIHLAASFMNFIYAKQSKCKSYHNCDVNTTKNMRTICYNCLIVKKELEFPFRFISSLSCFVVIVVFGSFSII